MHLYVLVFDTDIPVTYKFIPCWKYKALKEQNEGVTVQQDLDWVQPRAFSRASVCSLNIFSDLHSGNAY